MFDDSSSTLQLETAHILFMDIVGSSKLLTDQKDLYKDSLDSIVQRTPEYKQAKAVPGALIELDRGDGMALLFFRNSEAPARCALNIARHLKHYPQIKLRM